MTSQSDREYVPDLTCRAGGYSRTHLSAPPRTRCRRTPLSYQKQQSVSTPSFPCIIIDGCNLQLRLHRQQHGFPRTNLCNIGRGQHCYFHRYRACRVYEEAPPS